MQREGKTERVDSQNLRNHTARVSEKMSRRVPSFAPDTRSGETRWHLDYCGSPPRSPRDAQQRKPLQTRSNFQVWIWSHFFDLMIRLSADACRHLHYCTSRSSGCSITKHFIWSGRMPRDPRTEHWRTSTVCVPENFAHAHAHTNNMTSFAPTVADPTARSYSLSRFMYPSYWGVRNSICIDRERSGPGRASRKGDSVSPGQQSRLCGPITTCAAASASLGNLLAALSTWGLGWRP